MPLKVTLINEIKLRGTVETLQNLKSLIPRFAEGYRKSNEMFVVGVSDLFIAD